jgi:hypothetical protein
MGVKLNVYVVGEGLSRVQDKGHGEGPKMRVKMKV